MKHHCIDLHALDTTKSVRQHATGLGLSLTTLKRWLKQAGLYEQFPRIGGQEAARRKAREARDTYVYHPKKCACCDRPLTFEQKNYNFCSASCSGKFNYALAERRKTQGAEIKRRMAEGTWRKPCPPHREKSPRELKACEFCGKPMELLPYQIRNGRRFCSRQCANAGYTGGGGYREGSGRGKSGWYRDVFCNSTWELAWVIYHIDHGVVFTRNRQGFEYVFEGAVHLYYPDFILSDGTYVEVKGYLNERWKAKMAQFPHALQVFYKADMRPILQYVKDRYGADFVSLYTGNPHNDRRKQCVVCGKPARNKCCNQTCSGKLVASLRGWDKSSNQSRPSGESTISPRFQRGVPGVAPG